MQKKARADVAEELPCRCNKLQLKEREKTHLSVVRGPPLAFQNAADIGVDTGWETE